MKYISTDESEKYDIKHGALTESPVKGSTARFIANPIVDDIEADPPKGRARRQRINGRVVIDTTVPDGEGYQYEPPRRLVVGGPSVNDLATHRWHNNGLPDAATEAALIQRIKDGLCARPPKSNPGRDDERAFRQLLEAFHRTVVDPAAKYIPGGIFYRRQPEKQKHTNDQLYEDLTSVGCLALWRSVIRFDASKGRRFNTLSRHKILGAISNEANYLRQRGYTSGDTAGRYLKKEVGRRTQSRLDRWIFDNLGSTPEELLEAQKSKVKTPVFHSLEEAAEALKRANILQHPDIYSDSGDDDRDGDSYDTSKTNTATEPLEEYRDVYQSQDPLYWSQQLAVHRDKVSPIVDFWIGELCDPPRIKSRPQSKPVYQPCSVKPTGVVLRPIDTAYWMGPRESPPKEFAGKPYDPDRREVATVRLKSGKTKRQYRQIAATGGSDTAWRSEYLSHPYAESYTKYVREDERKKKELGINVRAEPNQAIGSPTAEIVVLESRRSRPQRFHVCQQCNPPSLGERFACEGTAG